MADEGVAPRARGAFAARIAIGLSQGLALYFLTRWKGSQAPVLFNALVLTAWLVPIAALGAVGAVRRTTLAIWLAAAAAITLGAGAYERFVAPDGGLWPSSQLFGFMAATLFVLHHLITPADAERRWRASYERYFDEGWKDAVRLALAALFVGVLWLLLSLGAQLFRMIGLDFLHRLIVAPWFAYPLSTTFFAIAINLTDVRANLVRGARTLALTLLAWLAPVMAVLAVGFLLALPFTGLHPLWRTRAATGSLLSACATLVILINAAYQDGERSGFPPAILKWSARVAAVALAPMVAIAAYGLALRVGQHGLSTSRIYAGACVVVAACYSGGYLWAAVSRGRWMKQLEIANWVTAQVAVVVVLLIFSSMLDPARIATADQMRRLAARRVEPQDFDYAFLRFDAGRWGAAGLRQLAAAKGDARSQEIAARAKATLRLRFRWGQATLTAADRASALHPVGGGPLPPGFLAQVWGPDEDPANFCGRRGIAACAAITGDVGLGPGPQVIVFGLGERRVYGQRNGRWMQVGALWGPGCPGDVDAAMAGRIRIVRAPVQAEIEVDGHAFALLPTPACRPSPAATGPVSAPVRVGPGSP